MYIEVRGVLSHGGTPSYHPFFFGIFHELNHPAIGYPHISQSQWCTTPVTTETLDGSRILEKQKHGLMTGLMINHI